MDAGVESPGDSRNCSDLPPIPQRILSLSGVVIETSSPVWRLGRPSEAGQPYSLNWELLDQVSAFPLPHRARSASPPIVYGRSGLRKNEFRPSGAPIRVSCVSSGGSTLSRKPLALQQRVAYSSGPMSMKV